MNTAHLPSLRQQRRHQRAFTMVEIAIAIGVIGFALVAIIGILPAGLNVQKDNREETIINQDGPYLLDAVRRGTKGLDYLTNHVEWVKVTAFAYNSNTTSWDPVTPRSTIIFTNDPINYPTPAPFGSTNWIDGTMTNGEQIIRRLSTRKFVPGGNPILIRQDVSSRIRALTGSALEQGGVNSQVAFTYILRPEVVPFQVGSAADAPALNRWSDDSTNVLADTNDIPRMNLRIQRERELQILRTNAYEVRLRFNWPALGVDKPGPNYKLFRGMVSGKPSDTGLFLPNLY